MTRSLREVHADVHGYVKGRLGLEKQENRINAFAFLTFAPVLLFFVLLAAIPVVYTLYLSFQDAGLFQAQTQWTGLRNYVYLWNASDFWASFWRGIVFATGSVVLQLLVGLVLALVLNNRFRGSSLARTLAIFPYLVPIIAVAMMWKFMLSPVYGLINSYALHFGLIEDSLNLFGNPDFAMPTLIATVSWKYTSFAVIILLARLQSIDDSLYEQAKISGAGIYQQFKTITLPNLRSAILLVVLLRFVWMFQQFGIIWMLTRGGPFGETTTLPIYIYKLGFVRFNLGRASAAAMGLFVVLVVAATVYFWVLKPSKEIDTAR